MADTPAPEQRKRVAEAIDGRRHVVRKDMQCTPIINMDGGFWSPNNDSSQWRELVTWLAKQDQKSAYAWSEVIVDAMANSDTDHLEAMVLEILEAQDD